MNILDNYKEDETFTGDMRHIYTYERIMEYLSCRDTMAKAIARKLLKQGLYQPGWVYRGSKRVRAFRDLTEGGKKRVKK